MKKVNFFLLFLIFSGIVFSSFAQDSEAVTENELQEQKIKDIETKCAFKMVKKYEGNQAFVILDVRTEAEFKEAHLKNAVNIDFYSESFIAQLNKLDKEKVYLVHCRTGVRSKNTVNIMAQKGFKTVNNLLGGIVKWISEGYPVVKE